MNNLKQRSPVTRKMAAGTAHAASNTQSGCMRYRFKYFLTGKECIPIRFRLYSLLF